MKKIYKRIVSLVLVMLLAMSMTGAVLAAGKIIPVKGTQTVYMPTRDPDYLPRVEIALATGTKAFTIKRDSVKVTGAKLIDFHKEKWTSVYRQEYSASGKWKTYTYRHTECTYTAGLEAGKPGTATVKYKIGSKSYSTKVKILAYKNPVKTITLTGVNGGKNFASRTRDGLYGNKDMTLPKDVAGAKAKVVPASGWKITSLRIWGYGDSYYSRYITCTEGLSSATLNCGKLSADKEYSLSVEFVNASNGATMYVYYYIIGANATSYGEG